MSRTRTTFDLPADVVRAVPLRAKRTGRSASEIVEEALREYLVLASIRRVRSRSSLDADAAIALAYNELGALRREREQT